MKRIEVMKKEHPEKINKDGTVKACIEEYGFKGKEYCSKKHELGIAYMQRLRCKTCWLYKARRWKE